MAFRRHVRAVRILVVGLLIGAGVAFTPSPSDAVVGDHATVLFTRLDGASERPGPGDPDATGTATIFIVDSTNTLCLILDAANVDGAGSGLHIHFAPPTAPGRVVIPFSAPVVNAGAVHHEECIVVANEALLDNIAENPQQYYINLHSAPQFPGGALRGQLARQLLRTGADLTGANERPGPGDPDATGTFDAGFDDLSNMLCFMLQYQNVDGTPSGLHIHLAPPTVAGPVVVPFATPSASPALGCVIIGNEALFDNLYMHPEQYYVNLHSAPQYPGGAIRGQLPGCTTSGGPRLTGTEGNDVLCGSPGAEQIFGLGGHDLIYGYEGGGYLDGGSGDDLIVGGDASENLYGQGGANALFGLGGFDRCQGATVSEGCEQLLP